MKKPPIFIAGLAAVSLLGLSACVTDPNTGERHISRTAIGVVGYQLDQQIRELEEATAGSGVDVTETDDGFLVNLPDVTFATGSTTITPSFQATLNEVAESLTKYPNSLIDVYGHTDTVGSTASNQTLSEERARAVTNYLTSRGVASNRIRWQGFGETQLKVATADNVNEPRNRRVEIKVVPISQEEVSAARGQ